MELRAPRSASQSWASKEWGESIKGGPLSQKLIPFQPFKISTSKKMEQPSSQAAKKKMEEKKKEADDLGEVLAPLDRDEHRAAAGVAASQALRCRAGSQSDPLQPLPTWENSDGKLSFSSVPKQTGDESISSSAKNDLQLVAPQIQKHSWDDIYERDKGNFKDHGDVGEIWFGEDSELRILRWMTKNNVPSDAHIIDLGCGNAMMLVELAREGFTNLTGVDYSESAIELSKSIVEAQSMDNIRLEVADLTASCSLTGFDVVLDKGTFDAISLCPDDAETKKAAYLKNVADMLNQNGLFIITSCNWTERELTQQFSSAFKHKHTIPTPSFNFGGKSGNLVSSVVFEKIDVCCS